MALKRMLLPALMIASTTAVLMSHVNEDQHQSMAAEVSNLTSQIENLRQENTELKLRVQLKDLQAEVAGLRRENSMLQRKGKAADGDFKFPMLVYLTKDTKDGADQRTVTQDTKDGADQRNVSEAMKGLIGYVERDQRQNGEYKEHPGDGEMLDGSVNVNFIFAEGRDMFEVPKGDLALLEVGQEVKFKGNVANNSFLNHFNAGNSDWLGFGIDCINQGKTFIIQNLDEANEWTENDGTWHVVKVSPKGHRWHVGGTEDGTKREYIVLAENLQLLEA